MLGYLLFLVPMSIAFIWIALSHGIKQALLDVLAFNLLFQFDFAAVLPGDLNVNVVDLLALALLGLTMGKILMAQRIRIRSGMVVPVLLLIFTMTWIGIAIIVNKAAYLGISGSIIIFFRVYFIGSALFFIGIQFTEKIFLRFVSILMFAGVIVGLITIVQSISNGDLLWHGVGGDRYLGIFQPLGEERLDRLQLQENSLDYISAVRTIAFGSLNFFRGPGTYEGVFVVVVIVALWSFYFMSLRQKISTIWLYMSFILTVGGTIMTFNRTAIITLLFMWIASLIFLRIGRLNLRVLLRWLSFAGMCVGVVAVLWRPLLPAVQANLDGFFGERGKTQLENLSGRALLWPYVLSQIKEHPLRGTGEPITPARAGWGDVDDPDIDVSAHNMYLEIAYRAGVIPAVLFTYLALWLLWKTFALAKRKNVIAEQRLQAALICIALGSMLLMNLSAPFLIMAPQLSALFWLLCGYGFMLSSRHIPAEKRSSARQRRDLLVQH